MQTLTRDQITEICGRLDDMRMADIIATGATPAELMEARTWLGSDDYLGAALRRTPGPRVSRLVEILKADETAEWDEP